MDMQIDFEGKDEKCREQLIVAIGASQFDDYEGRQAERWHDANWIKLGSAELGIGPEVYTISSQQTEHTTGSRSQKLMLISVLLLKWLNSTFVNFNTIF